MSYNLFEEVVLSIDIPERGLKKGDVATIVEHHPVSDAEDGYSLEIFNDGRICDQYRHIWLNRSERP